MSITIHHGSNGSFKTSGVVVDYLIPAALEGRVVVTNIRGVSRERTLLHLPECPSSFDVIHIDTDTLKGRAKIANWFQWVPQGAMLLFDEAGVNFPKAWTQRDLDKFNHPEITLQYCDLTTRQVVCETLNYIDSAELEWRPANWAEAWQKHRHWNWDIILTAPHIKYIREDIRLTTEGAYKHRNKALLGPIFKGYKEGYHNAQKNGESFSDFENVRDRRVPSIAFDLYDSTKTNSYKDTLNGFNLFKSPRLVLAMGVASAAFGYSVFSGGYELLYSKSHPESIEQTEVAPEASQALSVAPEKVSLPVVSTAKAVAENYTLDSFKALDEAFNSGIGNVGRRKFDKRDSLGFGPLSDKLLRIAAGIKSNKGFSYSIEVIDLDDDNDIRLFTHSQIVEMGYTIQGTSTCLASIYFLGHQQKLSCLPSSYIASM